MKPDKSPSKKPIKKAAKTDPEVKIAAPQSPPVPAAKSKPKTLDKVTVPSILLEDDQTRAATISGPGQRYALGPVPPLAESAAGEPAGELPEAYGTKQLLLTARDPYWLYARWDLTRGQQREYNHLSADRHLVLRVYTDAIKGEPFSQLHVHPESNHWFIHVGRAGTKYLAELGYYTPKGRWTTISTSGATLTPPDTMSEDVVAQFATIPIEVPFAELMLLAQAAVRENIPLAEVILQLRAAGHKKFADSGPSTKWTPEQQRALASIITMDSVRRVWMGSLEITELIRRQLQQQISSMSAAKFMLPSSPFGAVTSVSSPFGGGEKRRGFWFNVNAELIIYGATEPDAQVTIGGRVIKLRPDGTFSFRFALPDGTYELPAVAVSCDKTDGRAAELKFSRGTEYHGEVGVHPQDPQLKAPLAASVA